MIVRSEGRLLHFTSLNRLIWASSVCCTSADFTRLHFLQYIINHLQAGRRARQDKDVSLRSVVELVELLLVGRDGGVRLGDGLFDRLDGVDGLDGIVLGHV